MAKSVCGLTCGATAPKTGQLRDFLFERHARQQIGDASFNRKTRILVVRKTFLRVHFVAGMQNTEQRIVTKTQILMALFSCKGFIL